MSFLHAAWAIFAKDLKLELRSRYAINTLLVFVVSSLFLVFFSVGQEPLSEGVQSALLWIVILFSASIGLGRVFINEEERGTILLLQLNARPGAVYGGKLLLNFLLILGLNTVAAAGFLLFLGVEVVAPGLLAATLVLGAVGLAGATTLIAAIIARTANQGPLFAVLSFPVLIPLLAIVVDVTRLSLLQGGWADSADQLLALVGYAGVVITASFLLFDYVWND